MRKKAEVLILICLYDLLITLILLEIFPDSFAEANFFLAASYLVSLLNSFLTLNVLNSVESYKLLKEALEQQYRSALSAVVGPIQEEVKRSLSYVTGFLHEDVELNEYLFPTRLGERGFEDISLEFNDGSSGLKEVLALCIRLAVARHLSGRDSQCLVLDDPFVHDG